MIRTLVEIQGGRVSIRETGTGQTEVSVIVDDAVSTVPLGGQEERLYTAEEVGDFQASEAELVAAPLRLQVTALERQVHLYDVDRKTEQERANRNQTRAEKAEAEVERLKKGHVCTRSCKPDAHVAFTGRQRLEELEREAHDERERADQNKEWAELRLSKDAEHHLRRVRELTDSLAARDRLLASSSRDLVEMTTQRDRLLSQLHGPEGPHAKLIEAQEGIKVLAAQIGKVRGAVHRPVIRSALRTEWLNWTQNEAAALTQAIEDTRRAIGSPGPETSPA